MSLLTGALGTLLAVSLGACSAAVTPTPTPPAAPASPTPSPVQSSPAPASFAGSATPEPTQTPTALTEGDFDLRLDVPPVQWTGGPIEAQAELTYFGAMPEITVWGASSGLASFGFMQEDAAMYMGAGLNGLCVPYTLRKAVPLVLPVLKSAVWEPGDPDAAFYQAWLADPTLHLPFGYWEAGVQVAFVGSPSGYCLWASGEIPPEKEPIHLTSEQAIRVTPLVPLPMPLEGCIDDFDQPYAKPPESLLVGGDTNLRLTMYSSWSWRDSSGGGDADSGVYDVDLPAQPFMRARRETIGITVGPDFQLIDATATLYAAAQYVTNQLGVVSTGDALDHPGVSFREDGTLEVVVPDRPGSWVISVRVNWLTACLIGDGEVNFGVETR